MPASDALAIRTQVAEQLQGQMFRSMIDAFMADIDGRGFNAISKLSVQDNHGSVQFANAVTLAETYYLSPEMQELVQAASTASDFPDDEAILRSDPPSEAGFLYLPARFRIIEVRGQVMIAHAIVWLNRKVWWLSDRRDPEDEINQQLNEAYPPSSYTMPRWDLMAVDSFDWNKPLPTLLTFPRGVLPPSAKIEFKKDGHGNTVMITDHALAPDLQPSIVTSPGMRFLLTIWRLMQQTLSEIIKDDSHVKAVRRYANRAGIKDTGVYVIQLRRRESHATGTGRPLDHRFLVRGHWARRWCGPLEDRYLRAVYIHPYLKGPEDSPLIIREHVHALVR